MVNLKEEVDIVYLWVDSSDISWQKKRRESFEIFIKKNKDDIALYANSDGRFRDNDELRFNLRCLEKFFPDHGHIFIVTDEQIPEWLVQSDRITVIDHQNIIPNKTDPIFSSAHIESYIHHIPNLSEKFIYLNDDVFFGEPININWWFNNKLKHFYSKKKHIMYKKMQPKELSTVNGSIISNVWLIKHYPGYKYKNKIMAHSPKPFLKSLLFEIEKVAVDLFYNTRSTNFRAWNCPGIIGDFVPRWLEYNKYAEIIEIEELYIESGSNEVKMKLDLLAHKFGNIPFFCINDTCDYAKSEDERLQLVGEKLQALLPNKSSFET